MSDQGSENYRRYERAITFSNRLLAALCIHHPEQCPEAVEAVRKRLKARGAVEAIEVERTQQERIAAFAAQRKQKPRPVAPEMLLACVEPRRPSLIDIQVRVCECYGIDRIDMLSPRRTADIVAPRQIAMYLAKKLTLRSLPEIGKRFGGRDHTTVLHAVRKIADRVERDHQFAEQVEAVRLAIIEG